MHLHTYYPKWVSCFCFHKPHIVAIMQLMEHICSRQTKDITFTRLIDWLIDCQFSCCSIYVDYHFILFQCFFYLKLIIQQCWCRKPGDFVIGPSVIITCSPSVGYILGLLTLESIKCINASYRFCVVTLHSCSHGVVEAVPLCSASDEEI